MGNDLVPERRVNKNGVLVTKHVRASEQRNGRKSFLAALAPSLDRKLAEKAERRSLNNHFSEALDHWHRWVDTSGSTYLDNPERKQSYCDGLSEYSIENHRYVASLCDISASPEDQDRVMMVITNRSQLEDWAVTGLRYRNLLGDPKDKIGFLKRLSTVESHFSGEEHLVPADEYTDEHAFNAKVVGFALRVHDYVMESAGKIKLDYDHADYFTPVSHQLVQVLRDYPDREEDIFNFMKDRYLVPCMVSEEMFREYLDSPRTPLRVGVL
jgi:hypothetical protein